MAGLASGPDVPKQNDANTISAVPRLTVVRGSPVAWLDGAVVSTSVIVWLPSR
jgi:hypothetical protein